MSYRVEPAYPIWDNNTLTDVEAAGTTAVDRTAAANVYFVIISVGTAGEECFVRDDLADTAIEGVQLCNGNAGEANLFMHIAPGTTITVTRSGSTKLTFTWFYNSLTATQTIPN